MTVEQLLKSMTSFEFCEWRSFLEIERSGGLSQEAVDLDTKIKGVWAAACHGA